MKRDFIALTVTRLEFSMIVAGLFDTACNCDDIYFKALAEELQEAGKIHDNVKSAA